MLRQSEHLQCRRRQALAIFSFIVIFCIDFSCADNPNNTTEDTAIPAVLGRLHPLKLVGEIRDKTAGIGQGITTILKEPAQKDLDNLENLMNDANQKSSENSDVSDNNGGTVQSDESDSVPYHYMQSQLSNRRIGNSYRFGGKG